VASCEATKRHHRASARAVSARRVPWSSSSSSSNKNTHTTSVFSFYRTYLNTYLHYIVCSWYVNVGKITTQKCSDTRETCRWNWHVGAKIGDIFACRRHVADMSPTFPAKRLVAHRVWWLSNDLAPGRGCHRGRGALAAAMVGVHRCILLLSFSLVNCTSTMPNKPKTNRNTNHSPTSYLCQKWTNEDILSLSPPRMHSEKTSAPYLTMAQSYYGR
jgi:hypothetical protein